MSKLFSFIAATTFVSNTYEPQVKRKQLAKSPLSQKEKKVRLKNKAAKQSRKFNRNK